MVINACPSTTEMTTSALTMASKPNHNFRLLLIYRGFRTQEKLTGKVRGPDAHPRRAGLLIAER